MKAHQEKTWFFRVYYGPGDAQWLPVAAVTESTAMRRFDEREADYGRRAERAEKIA